MSRRGGDPRGGGTSAWLTAVRERTFGNVTEKFLMMTLCDYINGDDECWPGNVTLAPEIGVDPRTIKRTLARLEEVGVISRYKRQRTEGRGRATDVIVFLWEGFQRLPLVHPEADQGDTLSADQGDTEARPRGHSDTGPRGHSGTPSSFRTPQIEPPQENPSPIDYFAAFWKVYPRKTEKGDARKAWPKAVKAAGGDPDRIVQGAYRYALDPNRVDEYTKTPPRWLNAECWDDDPLPARGANGTKPTKLQRTFDVIDEVFDRLESGAG